MAVSLVFVAIITGVAAMAQYGKPAYWDERYTKCVSLQVRIGMWLHARLAHSRRAPPLCWHGCFTVVPRDPEPFDWYQRYSGLKDLVGQYMKADDHILMLGCGNSRTWHRPGKPCQATPALRGM